MSYNRTLAVGLAAAVAVVSLASAVGIALAPDEALKRFDTAWVRAALAVLVFLVSSLLAVELYGLWYDPTPLRMTRRMIAYVMAIGAVAAVSPFSFFGLQKVQGFGAEISFQQAGVTSVVILVADFATLILLLDRYGRFHRLAAKAAVPPAAGP